MRMNVQTFGWFIFLALIKNYSANNTPFTLQPRDLQAKEGCCAAINCTVTGSVNFGDVYWFWMKDGIWSDQLTDFNATIVYSSNNSRRAVSPEFAGRVQSINSSHSQKWPVCSILICDLKKNDSGEYSFRFVGKTAKQRWVTTENVNLKVEENPCRLTFHQPLTLSRPGQIKLTCSTLSSCPSYPEIQDLAQTSPTHLTENDSKSTTVDFEAQFEDDGKVFSCQIQNNMDKYCIQNISITVEYGPRDVVAQGPKTEEVKEGDSVNLFCSVKGHPQPNISWFKDESKQSTGPEWRIESIQVPQSGQYHCEAENKHGKDKSKPINITVFYAPQVEIRKVSPTSAVTEGNEMILICDLKRSNPQPTGYDWLKDKQKLNVETDTYSIVNIKPEHGGSYTCEARNNFGLGESKPLEIRVQYRPRLTSISCPGAVNNIKDESLVKVGSDIKLNCNTDSNPSPLSYSWYRYKDNKPTDSSWWQSHNSKGNELTLSKVQRSDEACYMCNATNSIGTGEDSLERCIRVQYPPTVPTLSMPGEVTEGQNITITCTVESYPVSQFTLTGTSNFVFHPSGDSNTVHHTFTVTSEHNGSYTCSAKNSEGANQSEKRTLVVKYIPKDVTVKPELGFEVDENNSLILHCNFNSYPSATLFTWMKNGDDGKYEILSNNQIHTIKSVSPSDSGLYSCEATNDVGTGKSLAAEVKVRYAPKNTTISRGAEKQERDGGSSIELTCSSHAYPSPSFLWRKKGKENDDIQFRSRTYKVYSNNPGVFYCTAENELGQKSSEPVNLFEQNNAVIVRITIFCIVLLFICLLLLAWRRKKSVQRQTTDTQSSFGFLVAWRGIRGGNLRNETDLAEPFRSRDDLLPEQPFRLKAQRCQARPDSTPASNINTVYSTVNLPTGKPTSAAQKSTGWQGGHTQDESLNYASLHFWNKPKTKQAKGEQAVYAKVSKPNPLQKNKQERLEDYENVSVAHTSKLPNPLYDDDDDSDTSDDEVDVSYAQVTFKPGCQKDDTDSSTSDDDETHFSDVKFNEGDVNYSQVTFTPKPGHTRDNTDSSTSDDDEIQFSDDKFNEGDVNYSQVTFTPKPGHMRDNKDSSTSDEDEIQYSDIKL